MLPVTPPCNPTFTPRLLWVVTAVHGNADGGPGPVIGHSELFPAGTSTEVVVTLDEPLTAT